ncbi:MAG TPA: helix-turn-helix transcriptional regulator [Bryobacteraceae bacterium]|nr:helix-turn-helix transcriptional regulator [Bryobacteraceae bacterium]
MRDYREIAPSPRFAAAIECFWTGHSDGGTHRVTPDGCADILLSGGALRLVGPMTGWRDFALEPGERLFGVRFRPGRWRAVAGPPADRLTDRLLPMDDLWGARAARLGGQLAEARSAAQAIHAVEAALPAPADASPIERALAWMERRRGAVSMDELASHAGLSPRQLRRVCLERTGLTPKFLARVLRFRHAQERLAAQRPPVPGRAPSALVDLALDCGYYDQAHFIHEFREFSGRTPAAAAPLGPDDRFFQSPADGDAVTSAA